MWIKLFLRPKNWTIDECDRTASKLQFNIQFNQFTRVTNFKVANDVLSLLFCTCIVYENSAYLLKFIVLHLYSI